MIKELLAATGLKQQQLADYAGISRSHLAMAERGERELPSEAHFKLTRLSQVCFETRAEKRADKKTSEAHLKKEINNKKRQAVIYRAMAKKQERMLASCLQAEAQVENFSRVIQKLRAGGLAGAPSQGDLLWMNHMEQVSMQRMAKVNLQAAHKLEWRIHQLNALAEAADKHAKDLEKRQSASKS